MKKILFILIIVAAACTLQIIGFQTVANAAWGEDALVTNYIPIPIQLSPPWPQHQWRSLHCRGGC